MRKADLVILVAVLGVTASLWHSRRSPSSATSAPPITRSAEAVPRSSLQLDLPGQDVEVLEEAGPQALLRVNMRAHRRLLVEITFGDPSQEWSFNLGDSPTNNGWGGDGGTCSNDAELEIVNGKLDIFGSDDLEGDQKVLLRGRDLEIKPGKVVRLELANGEVTGEQGLSVRHPALFALNGQPDREGPVNYDLFVGVNRVITGGRTGSGVTGLKLTFVDR